MHAQIISITKPIAEGLLHLTPEEFIAYQARISNPKNQHNRETSGNLLRYCLIHGHWSVFEMVDVTFQIETSRAIMAQILRHWSFRFQEFSQRYAAAGGFEPTEIRMKHKDGNRQGSSDPAPEDLKGVVDEFNEQAFNAYGSLLECGAAPESARFLLPLATTTTAYMKGSVRSWITYFWQRLDPHAQKEHRELATLIFAQFATHFPLISELTRRGKMKYVSSDEKGTPLIHG